MSTGYHFVKQNKDGGWDVLHETQRGTVLIESFPSHMYDQASAKSLESSRSHTESKDEVPDLNIEVEELKSQVDVLSLYTAMLRMDPEIRPQSDDACAMLVVADRIEALRATLLVIGSESLTNACR